MARTLKSVQQCNKYDDGNTGLDISTNYHFDRSGKKKLFLAPILKLKQSNIQRHLIVDLSCYSFNTVLLKLLQSISIII